MRNFFPFFFIFSLLALTSCGSSTSETDTASGKTAFYVKTLDLSNASGAYTVESSARLTAGSTLTLSSEGVGEVASIPLKEGDAVKAGWAVVKLSDTVGMYGIQLRQAQVGVKTQSTSLETTTLSLDRAVADAETALAQAQRAYDTVTRDIAEQEKQAKLDYENADPNNTGSVASLNIEKLRLDLENANQNYDNTITNLDANFHLYANEVDKTVTAMLYDGDKILGISEYWEHNNDIYEPLLGAQLGNIKNDSDNDWGDLYSAIGSLRADKDLVITRDNVEAETAKITAVYTAARNFNSSMITMFQNTLVGGGLTQTQIDGWISLYTGYKTQITAGDSGFSAWKSQAVTGLDATETSLDSLKAQLAIAEKNIETGASGATIGYTRTLIALQDAQKSSALALEQAQRSLEIAQKNRNLGISQANIGIENAQISLLQAQTNYGKLTIDAPIDGKITKILVSPGESLNAGTPAVEMVSLTPEISLDVEKAVAYGVNVGDNVSIDAGGKILSGTVIAISRVANSNLMYTTRISVPSGEDMIGQSVKVFFTVVSALPSTDDLSLPIDAIHIISENEGEIYLLTQSGSELIPETLSIMLGEFRGESIEVLTHIPDNSQIIMTNIDNFDPEKQKLVKESE